jgi:hypothetical protein
MARSDMYRKLAWTGGDPRQVAEIVNNLVEGKSNNTGEVTLNTSWATTTTINDERIGYNSYIGLMPISDAAEADTAPYGSFSNNTDQTAPTVGSTAVVVYDTTEESNGVFLSSSSRLNVRNAGIYNVPKEYSDSEIVPENVSTEATEVQNNNEDFIDSSANAMGIGIF